MKSAIETMTGIIVITIMTVIGTSLITASLNTLNAQNYHAAVIQEIEESNYAPAVIENCKKTAKENKFKNLEITVKESTNGKKYAKVVLEYNYSIPILNMFMDNRIPGYAR